MVLAQHSVTHTRSRRSLLSEWREDHHVTCQPAAHSGAVRAVRQPLAPGGREGALGQNVSSSPASLLRKPVQGLRLHRVRARTLPPAGQGLRGAQVWHCGPAVLARLHSGKSLDFGVKPPALSYFKSHVWWKSEPSTLSFWPQQPLFSLRSPALREMSAWPWPSLVSILLVTGWGWEAKPSFLPNVTKHRRA